jgi:hypothetical protein
MLAKRKRAPQPRNSAIPVWFLLGDLIRTALRDRLGLLLLCLREEEGL